MIIYAISDVSYVHQLPRYQKDWYFQSYFEAVEYAKDLVAEDYGTDFDSKRLITKTVGDTTYIQYKGYQPEGYEPQRIMTYYAVEAIKVR